MRASGKFLVMTPGRIAGGGFAVLIAIKLTLLAVIGPVLTPDTAEYLNFARAIATGNLAVTDADFAKYMAPVIMFRMAGYPALLAVAQAISEAHWTWIVAAAQIAVSAGTTIYFYKVAHALAGDWRAALFLAFAQATALNGAIDQFILTDSFYVSLCTLATLALVDIALLGKPVPARLLLASASLTGAFLLREAHLMLCLLWAPLATAALMKAHRKISAIILTAVMLAPVFAAAQIYQNWNQQRSGARMLTTVYQVVLLHPLVRAQRYDAQIFGGNSSIDQTVRAMAKNFDYADTVAINQKLHRDDGWRAPDFAREMHRRYWQAWRHQPLAMLRAASDRAEFNHALMFVQPLATLNFLLSQSSSEWRNAVSFSTLKARVFRSGQLQFLPLLILDIGAKITSLFVVALGAGALLATHGHLRLLAFALLILPAGYYAAHIIVHFDDRYMMPVIPAVLLVAAIGVRIRAIGLPTRRALPEASDAAR